MAKAHIVKLKDDYFLDYISGRKTFEYRFNDRNYEFDDILVMVCIDKNGRCTNRFVVATISKVYSLDEINDNHDYVILNLDEILCVDLATSKNYLVDYHVRIL